MDPGRIHEHHLRARQSQHALDSGTRSLRTGPNDRELSPHQCVQQSGFPGVRSAENGNESCSILHLLVAFATLTCSTRRLFAASTVTWMPSRSAPSPTAGTCPSHSVIKPPTVVDSVASLGRNSIRSANRPTSKLPDTT